LINRDSLANFGGATQGRNKPDQSGFDLGRYLLQHRFEVIRVKPWQSHPGGLVHELDKCPFNPDHTGGSAAFLIEGGKPGFRCQHNGCKAKTIKEVFAAFPPEPSADAALTDWPALIPLAPADPDPIPMNCLPSWLGDMARAVSESTETPFDLAALLAIAVASSCVAAKAEISPEPGYVEPLNMFVCPAMESGNRKTAVFNRLMAPITEWERIEVERTEPERKRQLSERRTIEARIERLRKKAAGAVDPSAVIQEMHQLEKELPEVPPAPRLFSDDITPERLASLMQEQGGRMAVFSDEGGVFDMLAGRYSKGVPNLDLWLKGHSRSPVRVDRQDRSRPPIIIDRPHLTAGISTQPDVLESLHDKPGFRGRGLLARFLYGLPQSRLGYRTLAPKPISSHVEDRYRLGIQQLINCRPAATLRLQFSDGAYREWKDFQLWLEPQFRDGGALQSLRDWGGKLAGAVARLAGIFHMVLQSGRDEVETEIAFATVRLAIELGICLISHAKGVFALMDRDPALNDAEKLVAWMIRQGKTSFTVRDCFRAHQGRFQRVDAMQPILTLLEQHGYIRRAKQGSGGGRPASDLCDVNPAALARGTNELDG
jgi:putative DNA primase/helicase